MKWKLLCRPSLASDAFPSETKYVQVQLQEGFKLNPLHVIGPQKSEWDFEFGTMRS